MGSAVRLDPVTSDRAGVAFGARRGGVVGIALGALLGPGSLAVELTRHGTAVLNAPEVLWAALLASVAGAGVVGTWGVGFGALWAFARSRTRR
jgi:hypothetical protein